MTKIVLFNNATAVPAAAAGNTDPSDIAEARVAAFDADDFGAGTLDLTTAVPESVKRIQFVQGSKTGEDPILSPIINVHEHNFDVKEVTVKAYSAPTKQVTKVTPSTGTGSAGITLVRQDTGYRPSERTSVEIADIDGLTVKQIIDKFVELINATDFPVTATNNADTTLDLTADEDETDHTNPGVSFFTATQGQAADWTVAIDTTPDFGSGTEFHLKNIEEIAWGGNYTNRIYLPITPPSYVTDGGTYDLNILKIRTNTTENIAKSNKFYELIIAVHNSQSGIDLEEFFYGDRPAT